MKKLVAATIVIGIFMSSAQSAFAGTIGSSGAGSNLTGSDSLSFGVYNYNINVKDTAANGQCAVGQLYFTEKNNVSNFHVRQHGNCGGNGTTQSFGDVRFNVANPSWIAFSQNAPFSNF